MNLNWKYYNHALMPRTPPHILPDLDALRHRSTWRLDGKRPLFARYVSDWDCGCETGWWYVIKDSPFDVSALKAKRRYEITKGKRFFEVREILPSDYGDALSDIQTKALEGYPEHLRPAFNKDSFTGLLQRWTKRAQEGKVKVFGAFFRESGRLCGYSVVVLHESYYGFTVQKTIPEYEKFALNAALVDNILETFSDGLATGKYLSDGARAISHETHFQDYLEKYFGFRKAYCKLRVVYPLPLKVTVTLLFPFRRLFKKFEGKSDFLHLLSAILTQEEIARRCDR